MYNMSYISIMLYADEIEKSMETPAVCPQGQVLGDRWHRVDRHLADSREVGAAIAGVPRRGIRAILIEGHPRRLQNWLPGRTVQAEAQGRGAPRV